MHGVIGGLTPTARLFRHSANQPGLQHFTHPTGWALANLSTTHQPDTDRTERSLDAEAEVEVVLGFELAEPCVVFLSELLLDKSWHC